MVSNGNRFVEDEIQEANVTKSKAPSPLHALAPNEDGLTEGTMTVKKSGFLSSSTFRNLGATSTHFWKFAQGRDDISRAVTSSSSHGLREKISGLAHKISWDSLKKISKEWFRNPMNLALFVWIACVAVSGGILFLVMTGMLNGVLLKKSQRNAWFEVNNQILNALFTLMCLYQHPKRIHHLVMLLRWKSKDISNLRKLYCKNGTYKPHEWAHMLVVILLLNLNCFAQYALCGLNVGYKRSQRPPIGVGICISVAIAAPAVAGVYTIVSPLGKEYTFPNDEEAQLAMTDGSPGSNRSKSSFERRLSFRVNADEQPEWVGGIFDFWDDISLAFLSLCCSCCVFGWNMERLGFGNMYVHIATFILFCSAPYWIFNLAALNINNESVRQALGFTGVILCALGLLYGGYWRIRMRKRFNLPGYTSCCGKAAVTDCALWLCCCWCSLAQEARTTNFYEIVEDKMCKKQPHDGIVELGSSELPCNKGIINDNNSCPSSPPMISSGSTLTSTSNPNAAVQPVQDNSQEEGMTPTMKPPSPLFIDRDRK